MPPPTPITPEEQKARTELQTWQQQLQRPPSLLNEFARRVQICPDALLPKRLRLALVSAGTSGHAQ